MTTSVDFDSFDLNDVADLPEFVLFPIGAHRVKLNMKLETKNDKSSVKLVFSYVENMELANPADEVNLPKAGDVDSTMYMLGSEIGAGKLKQAISGLIKHFNITNLKALAEQCVDLECVLINKHRADGRAGKEDVKYLEIVSLAVI